MLMYLGKGGDMMDADLFRRRVCFFCDVKDGEVFTLRGHYDALYIKGIDYEGRPSLTNIYDGRCYLAVELSVNDDTSCLVFNGKFVEDLSCDPDKFSLNILDLPSSSI